jgi:hypothetical protein
MSKQNNFAGLSERGVQAQVGRFGEDVVTSLLGGERVADNAEYPFADVVVEDSELAIEVKACNGRHSVRILPEQCLRLYNEVTAGFRFTCGVFACVFYNGVHRNKGRDGKSKIWSRRFSEADRRAIISEELRQVFFIDVGFLKDWTAKNPDLLKNGSIVSSEGRSDRDVTIELGRMRLYGFLNHGPQQSLLRERYGHNRWTVSTKQVEFCFTRQLITTRRIIPVHYIGSRRTGRVVSELISTKHPPIQLDFNNILQSP